MTMGRDLPRATILVALLACAPCVNALRIGSRCAPFPHACASPRSRCVLMAELPLTESSTLAELRAFVKAEGLDVKTSGPGRNKAAIYQDVVTIWSSKGEAAAPSAPAAKKTPEAAKPAVKSAPAPAPAAESAAAAEPAVEVAPAPAAAEPAAEETEASTDRSPEATAAASSYTAPAPDGFDWGGTF